MLLYWSIFIIIAICSLLEQSLVFNKKTARALFYAMICVLFLLGSLRWERGSDWEGYYLMFMNGGERSMFNTHTESGYLLLNKLVYTFSKSYTVFLIVLEGMYYGLYLIIAKKINALFGGDSVRRCYFPLLLFDFSQGFAGMFAVRSTLAYIICLVAFFFINEKKPIRFTLFVLVASTIHLSSLLFMLAYPLYKMKLNIITMIIMIIGAIVFFQLSSSYGAILEAINFGDYKGYIRGEERMSILGIMKWLTIAVGVFFIRPQRKNDLYAGMANIVIFGVIIYIWCQFFSPVAQRLSGLFTQCILIWFSFTFYLGKKKERILLVWLMIAYCGLSLWFLFNSAYKPLFIPYKFFWDTFSVEVF